MKERPPPAPVDWQAAVDAAMRVLVVAAARRYGLIHTPSQGNEQQAKRILELGRRRQFVPTPDDSNRFLIDKIRKERTRLCRLLMLGLEDPDTCENGRDDCMDTGELPVDERRTMGSRIGAEKMSECDSLENTFGMTVRGRRFPALRRQLRSL